MLAPSVTIPCFPKYVTGILLKLAFFLFKERNDGAFASQLGECLSAVRGLNKTDVLTLQTSFGSLRQMMQASADELARLPGFGDQKVGRLREAFTQPFLPRLAPLPTGALQQAAEGTSETAGEDARIRAADASSGASSGGASRTESLHHVGSTPLPRGASVDAGMGGRGQGGRGRGAGRGARPFETDEERMAREDAEIVAYGAPLEPE